MHRDPTPQDRPPLDTESTGYDPREHEHGQHAVAPPAPLPDTLPTTLDHTDTEC